MTARENYFAAEFEKLNATCVEMRWLSEIEAICCRDELVLSFDEKCGLISKRRWELYRLSKERGGDGEVVENCAQFLAELEELKDSLICRLKRYAEEAQRQAFLARSKCEICGKIGCSKELSTALKFFGEISLYCDRCNALVTGIDRICTIEAQTRIRLEYEAREEKLVFVDENSLKRYGLSLHDRLMQRDLAWLLDRFSSVVLTSKVASEGKSAIVGPAILFSDLGYIYSRLREPTRQ